MIKALLAEFFFFFCQIAFGKGLKSFALFRLEEGWCPDARLYPMNMQQTKSLERNNPQLISASLLLLCYSSSPKAEQLQCLVHSVFFQHDLVKAKDCIVATRIFAPEMTSHTTTSYK